VPKPEVQMNGKGGIGLIAWGTTHWAIVESRDQLSKEESIDTSYLRLRAFPFTDEVWDFIDRCDRVYVVEQNRDGQMLALLKMECTVEQFAKLRSIRKRQRRIHHDRVEVRHADLEGVRHRYGIDVAEQLIRQVAACRQGGHALERGRGAQLVDHREIALGRRPGASRCGDGRRQETRCADGPALLTPRPTRRPRARPAPTTTAG
jgi:hypothetical protein